MLDVDAPWFASWPLVGLDRSWALVAIPGVVKVQLSTGYVSRQTPKLLVAKGRIVGMV